MGQRRRRPRPGSSTTTISGTWRRSPHLRLSGDYQVNDVELPQGSFTTHLQRGRISVPITAWSVADSFLQWNGLAREINTQVRRIEQSRALQTKLSYRRYW